MIEPGFRAWLAYLAGWARAALRRRLVARWSRPEPLLEDVLLAALSPPPLHGAHDDPCDRCGLPADVHIVLRDLTVCWPCLEDDPADALIRRPGQKPLKPGTCAAVEQEVARVGGAGVSIEHAGGAHPVGLQIDRGPKK